MSKKLCFLISVVIALALAAPAAADELMASYEDSEYPDLSVTTHSEKDPTLTVTSVPGGTGGAPPATDGDNVLKWVWTDETQGNNPLKIEIEHNWATTTFDLAGYNLITADVWFDDANAQPATIGIWNMDIYGTWPDGVFWAPALSVPYGLNQWHTVEMDIGGADVHDYWDGNDLTCLFAFLFEDLAGYSGVLYTDNMWLRFVRQVQAWRPIPFDEAVSMDPDVDLSWEPGLDANSHDVYFGTSWSEVNDANNSLPVGTSVYKGNQALGDTSYDPCTLERLTTYYWRIDEVNEADPNVWKGDIWSFKTAPKEYAEIPLVSYEDSETHYSVWTGLNISGDFDVSLILGDKLAGGSTWDPPGPLLPVNVPAASDGSNVLGLVWTNEQDLEVEHGCTFESSVPPFTYDLEGIDEMVFDVYYALNDAEGGFNPLPHVMGVFDWRYVPSFNGSSNLPTTRGEWHTIVIDVSHLNNVGLDSIYDFEFMAHGEDFDPNGADPNNWGALVFMDNLRLRYYLTEFASNPDPANRATDVDRDTDLSWMPGMYAASHNVYFGTTSPPPFIKNQTEMPYDPGTMTLGTTYYWRIDEVNDACEPYLWEGRVWSFTTADYLVVDNFEDYNNTSNKIQDTWIKGGGGTVGYPDPNYAEITVVHGGEQSMPFDYNNVESPYDSNATRTFVDPCDWTAEGVKALTLWFRGWPAYVGSFTGSDPYTITASGGDIWDVPDLRNPSSFHDEFHYAYKEITGTPTTGVTTIIAKVENVSPTDPWAKAGVMIRQSLDPNSTNGFMCITPEIGASFQYRDTAGGPSTSYNYEDDPCMANASAPYWVKMTFTIPGYYVRGYYSPDPGTVAWISTTAGPALTIPIYVGLAVTAHNPVATCTAEFSNVSITAPGLTISPSWSHQDIGIKSNVAAPLYVTLQDDGSVGGDTATVTHTDPNATLIPTWQAWDIPLNDFEVNNPSLDLEKIKKITLGVGPADPCGTGTLYFDDIRLYIPRCILEYAAASFNDDCVVDLNDLDIMTDDWLLSEYDVNAVTPSDANLVALYEFEGGFNDSFNGHHGDPCGGAHTVYDAVRNSNVLSLDGDGDYVVITGSNTPGGAFDINDVITVACWIKVSAFDKNFNTIIAKGDDSWRLARYQETDQLEFAASGLSGGAEEPFGNVIGSTNVDDGQWHHVAGVYDGSKICIYVDGILDNTEDASGSISNSTYNVLIGENEEAPGREWNGQIDELRIYNRALSHGEIVSLAGESQVTQPLPMPEVDLYEDGEVNFKDYAILANVWLEEILWPLE